VWRLPSVTCTAAAAHQWCASCFLEARPQVASYQLALCNAGTAPHASHSMFAVVFVMQGHIDRVPPPRRSNHGDTHCKYTCVMTATALMEYRHQCASSWAVRGYAAPWLTTSATYRVPAVCQHASCGWHVHCRPPCWRALGTRPFSIRGNADVLNNGLPHAGTTPMARQSCLRNNRCTARHSCPPHSCLHIPLYPCHLQDDGLAALSAQPTTGLSSASA
jgi:hypothetical protein